MSAHVTHHDDCGCLTERYEAEVTRLRAVLFECESVIAEAVRYHGSTCSAEDEDRCHTFRRYLAALASIRSLRGETNGR